MRRRVSKSTGYEDAAVNELARDCQAAFESIRDITTHRTTVVWYPPFVLGVPYFGGSPRLTSPEAVICARAKNLTDPTILVTPGSGAAFDWIGNNQVRIDDVSGLTPGSKYELTFMVIG